MARETRCDCHAKESRCLARSVAEALGREPGLEAVTIDLNRKAISVATLGRAEDAALSNGSSAPCGRRRSTPKLSDAASQAVREAVETVRFPLSEDEHRKINIERSGQRMTISRVTCPTAPKFWRWRDLPWPKVVPREVEFVDDEEHLDEWKAQLVAAGLCGALGVAGFLFLGIRERPGVTFWPT